MGHARFPDRAATGVVEVRSDLDGLDRGGFWAVVVTFEGTVTCVRFASVTRSPTPPAGDGAALWPGVGSAWHSSLDEQAYRAGVADIRDRIAAGEVYQVNLCRILSHAAAGRRPGCRRPGAVARRRQPRAVRRHDPTPRARAWRSPPPRPSCSCAAAATGSSRARSRAPRATAGGMLAKDYAENVMIVDLVRNDLGHVCRPGTVSVARAVRRRGAPGPGPPGLHGVGRGCAPGARLARDLLAATFPPGSVSARPSPGAADHRRARAGRRAARTAAPSAGSTPTAAGRRSPSASARSGPTGTRPAGGGCASAPAPASPGAPTRRGNGRETELKAARLWSDWRLEGSGHEDD